MIIQIEELDKCLNDSRLGGRCEILEFESFKYDGKHMLAFSLIIENVRVVQPQVRYSFKGNIKHLLVKLGRAYHLFQSC